jgi:hypothetical protein
MYGSSGFSASGFIFIDPITDFLVQQLIPGIVYDRADISDMASYLSKLETEFEINLGHISGFHVGSIR